VLFSLTAQTNAQKGLEGTLMTTIDLSIVIITLNEEHHLPRLLADLNLQTWQNFEIIHVDSASTDNTVPLSQHHAKNFKHYRIVQMEKRGVSLGRNTGAAQAKGRRILFLDADTRLPPNFLAESMWELEYRSLDIGIVLMSSYRLPAKQVIGYELMNLGITLSRRFFPTAVGACLFSTPQTHETIGGFDEKLKLCEDCNYVLKAQKTGRFSGQIIKPRFMFNPRRLNQDGILRTGWTYLKANLLRFFKGELYKNEVPYEFGHYSNT